MILSYNSNNFMKTSTSKQHGMSCHRVASMVQRNKATLGICAVEDGMKDFMQGCLHV